MKYIDDLDLTEQQRQAFNFGFVGLSKDDALVLMNIDLYVFEEAYEHYYNLGNSFCKFETLKKIHDKSEIGLESLKEYGKFRDIFIDENEFKLQQDSNDTNDEVVDIAEPISTADLIKKMKGEIQ